MIKKDDYNSDGFPWSESWQEAVIGHIFTNKRFANNCASFLKPHWFTGGLHLQQIMTTYKEFYERTKRVPDSYLELMGEPFFMELKADQLERYRSIFDTSIKISIKNFGLDEVKRHLTGFARAAIFKEAMKGAIEQYKNRVYTEAYKWTKEKIEELEKTTLEGDLLAMDLTNPSAWLFDEKKRKSESLSTGSQWLDHALGGGLFKGETTAIMAPTNTGKTTSLVTMARHAIVNERRVMFFFHEGRPDQLRQMILASLIGCEKHLLYEMWNNPGGRILIEWASRHLDKYLTLIPYVMTGKMFVEDVITEALKRIEAAKQNNEQPYDLLIDDYPKKLKSRYRSGKDSLYRAELAEIYDQFNHLAAEANVHCLLAIQTNRSGSKQNRGTVETDFALGVEEIDESFGIAQNMANIITLNRSPADSKNCILTYNVAKSRNDQTDIMVRTRTAYDCSLTHGDHHMFMNFGQKFLSKENKHLHFGYSKGMSSYLQLNNMKDSSDLIHIILQEVELGKAIPTDDGVVRHALKTPTPSIDVKEIETPAPATDSTEVKVDKTTGEVVSEQ